MVGVVPVQQDARQRRAGRLGDPLPELVDLGRLDGEGVDAAEHDGLPARLERKRARLERPDPAARRPVASHHSDHGQPERRVDGERCRACAEDSITSCRG